MTNWVITQTDRFRAAVSGACLSNRHSFYGTSDIGYTFGEHHWQGNAWDDPERLLERSPLMYVDQIDTPLLLLHGEGDLRCPVGQSDELYHALKRLKEPVAYVRYPDEFHGFKQPVHRIDRYERLAAWFDHHLSGQRANE
jgi:dipeptidyl aminopeptidase/acylaminoacyl peptidase